MAKRDYETIDDKVDPEVRGLSSLIALDRCGYGCAEVVQPTFGGSRLEPKGHPVSVLKNLRGYEGFPREN